MKYHLNYALLIALVLPMLPAAGAVAGTRPINLRCEYLENPLGIDVRKPRFNWQLAPVAGRRGLRQSAYQIRLADAPNRLSKDDAILWDSGKVTSSQSVLVEYGGKELVSNHSYCWQVQVWDEDGATAGWSQPARFSTGLLDSSSTVPAGIRQLSCRAVPFPGVEGREPRKCGATSRGG